MGNNIILWTYNRTLEEFKLRIQRPELPYVAAYNRTLEEFKSTYTIPTNSTSLLIIVP